MPNVAAYLYGHVLLRRARLIFPFAPVGDLMATHGVPVSQRSRQEVTKYAGRQNCRRWRGHTYELSLAGTRALLPAPTPVNPPDQDSAAPRTTHTPGAGQFRTRLGCSGRQRHATRLTGHRRVVRRRRSENRLGWPGTVHAEKGDMSHYAAPVRPPSLARMPVWYRATRMTWRAPIWTGGAGRTGRDLH